MHLALFDLDHTLLDGDSNTLWLQFLIANDLVPATVLSQQADYYQRYLAEQLDIADYLRFQLSLLSKRPLAEWLPLRQRFVSEIIVPRIADAAHEAVSRHRRQGDRLAIITATHSFLSEAIAALFDLPLIAPQAEQRAGALTGEITGIICFREQKILALQHWLASERLELENFSRSYFYSDSANDLPLLQVVSHPVAVNADAKLAHIASQHNWPQQNWLR